MQRCCQRLVQRAVQPADSPELRQRKQVWVPLTGVLWLLNCISLLLLMERPAITRAGALGSMVSYAGVSLGFFYPLVTRRLPMRLVSGVLLIGTGAVVLMDATEAARGSHFRPWIFIILIMDVCLALDVPRLYQRAILCIATAWIIVFSLETGFRLGLYDIEGFTEDGSVAHSACDCSNPPCGVGVETIAYIPVTVAVLLTDFFATRGFAEGLRSEQQKVMASVRVSSRVTRLLARYATEEARRVVAEEGATLPGALRASYLQLLANLDSYRVFLPDSLLFAARQQQQQQQQHGQSYDDSGSECLETQVTACIPPGLGRDFPEAAVCFTDIQSSTELWEAFPQGMYEALDIHNKVMRSTYAACQGYEVKTIGDSFMVVFEEGREALRFGLEAQLGLLRQQWPEDLLTHHLCCWASTIYGQQIWGGLRVRVGVQEGPVRVERNPVTLRCDYFGPTVNTAARLESALKGGGFVATSDSVVSSLNRDALDELGSPVVYDLGNRELKGVREPVRVWALVPRVLRGRQLQLREEQEILGLLNASGTISQCSPLLSDSALSSNGPFGGVRFSQMGRADTGVSEPRSQRRASVESGPSERSFPSQERTPRAIFGQSFALTTITCATARVALQELEPVPNCYPAFAAVVARAADQTQGVIDALLSACVHISWNASRPCADHADACRRFLATPFRAQAHLGAASGGCLSGGIAAGRRSFATTIGGCIDFASALAEEAECSGDAALAAGEVAEKSAAAGAACCAQLWQPPCGPAIVVYEMWAVEGDKWLLSEEHEQCGGRWADSAACSVLLLRAISAGAGSQEQDALLCEVRELGGARADRLVERIASGRVRCRAMPSLWEPSRAASRAASRNGSRAGSPVSPERR